MASMSGVWKWLSDFRRWSLIAGIASFTLLISLFGAGVIDHGSVVDGIGANIFTWLWMMVFLGYGYRYLSFVNPLLAWAREASYPFYILHQTVIVGIGYYIIQCSWAPWTKYFFILILSMGTCYVLYDGCIRRFAVLRLIFGMKVEPAGLRFFSSAGRRAVRDDIQ
ncbi:hypothetical protein [Dyella sp. 20L07]|uniref:hypothetical protein n=1 Tax=Dyella sp. 20L07 TaxID=3384240 RepID=UPI003D2D04EF